MAAPEMDAFLAQVELTKTEMLKAASIINTQAINPAQLAAGTATLKTATDTLAAMNAAHAAPTETPAAV